MNKAREALLLLLPCVGLLALGVAFKRSARSELVPQRASPQALRVRVAAEPVPGKGFLGSAYVSVHTSVSSGSRPLSRLYLNCRIVGKLNNRPHVFYSSGGFDPYACWSKTERSVPSELSSVTRQVFRMSGIPQGASALVYEVEAVALEGAPARPQEMTRSELQQARLSPRLVGTASASTPLPLLFGLYGRVLTTGN